MKLALLLVSIFVQRTAVATEQCNRRLYETNNEKTPGNNGFVIEISSATIASEDSATSYLPGDKYTGILYFLNLLFLLFASIISNYTVLPLFT